MNCDKDKPLSDPIKVDVLESLYRRDDSVVTGVRFTYASGATHMRFVLSRLWPESDADIPSFTQDLVGIAQHVTPAFDDSAGREVWVFAADRSWLAELIDLTAADLQRVGLDSVTLLDRDLNCVLHLLTGRPTRHHHVGARARGGGRQRRDRRDLLAHRRAPGTRGAGRLGARGLR